MTEQTWAVTEQQTIEIDDISSVKLDVFNGRLDISSASEGGARIDVGRVTGDPLSITLSGGKLEIRQVPHGPQGWIKSLRQSVTTSSPDSVLINIVVPEDAGLEAGIVGGEIQVRGRQASAKLTTVNGTISTQGTEGDLQVTTVSGGVTVNNHDGVLTARSVSGPVTASGHFSHIRANTVSGNMVFDLLGFTEDFGANSVSGDLTVRLPANVGVDLVANSPGGSVVIDDAVYSPPIGKLQTIAGPDARLLLARTNSVSGTVSFLHLPKPPA